MYTSCHIALPAALAVVMCRKIAHPMDMPARSRLIEMKNAARARGAAETMP